MNKQDYLRDVVRHVDIKSFDARPIIDAYQYMAFQSRTLARAADIYTRMLADTDCAVILTLAGSLISAGLKQVITDLIDNNMVDAVVSTGANIVDQDFFEALGYRHYIGSQWVDDQELRKLAIDRIYDTYIDEDHLRVCDMTVAAIAGKLEKRPYSSREFIEHMGAWIHANGLKAQSSIIYSSWKKGVPIFVPAFSDCSAGFGLVHHQWENPESHLSIDSVADFREITRLKLEVADTGILMIGGGVPKNFTQDIVVATEILGEDRPMHKYAIQLTVADERDGALSGSTLKEACSWGKVDTVFEQMVYGEATVTFPLLASDAWHRGAWKNRPERRLNDLFKR
jgi:deoxyhypusine synthase